MGRIKDAQDDRVMSEEDIIGRLAPSDQWAPKDPRDKRVPWLVYQ